VNPPRLCVVAHTIPRAHHDACSDPKCTGCRPALAGHNSLVCDHHDQRVRDGLRDLPDLDEQLLDPWRSKRAGTGNGEPPAPANPDRIAIRDQIRQFCWTWCHVLADDWGITLPDRDTIAAMTHTIAVQAGRLLNSEHADQLVVEMYGGTEEQLGIARRGLVPSARALAYPAGRQPLTIACDCGGRVALTTDNDVFIVCPHCGERGVLAWWRAKVAPRTTQPMAEGEAIAWLYEQQAIVLQPGTIRQWVARNQLTALRVDGRNVYDPVELALVAMAKRERQVG
jgi:hypothetical protein